MVETGHEDQISPKVLQTAVDTLLDSKGSDLAPGTVFVEFFPPGEVRVAPEDRTFEVLSRHKHGNDPAVYLWQTVMPSIGSYTRRLNFDRDRVIYQFGDRNRLLEKNSRLEDEAERTLSAEKTRDLYDWMTDPDLKLRDRVLTEQHRSRTVRRPWFRRAVANLLKPSHPHQPKHS
jgi:hypothetical protein